MLRPRIETLALDYGRLHGEWQLPAHDDRPVLISGPNGSGKTTLVEGLVHTLFGYHRWRRGEQGRELMARQPWDGDGMIGRLQLARNGRRLTFRRDFEDGRVRIEDKETGEVEFDGAADPGARNQEARQYRRLLVELFGLQDLRVYEATLLIRQGGIADTVLGDHLLRIAAGGNARVDGASRSIAERHRAITSRPMGPASEPAITPRELERVENEMAALEERLREARQAGEQRRPLALDRERTAQQLEHLQEEIHLLEEAQSTLARSGTVEMEARQLRGLTRKLERAGDALEAALEEHSAAETAADESTREGVYPEDLPERLARAELRWRDLQQLRERLPSWPAPLGLVILAGAAVLLFLGRFVLGGVLAAVGGLLLAAWLALWLDSRRRARQVREELEPVLADVPQGRQLGPDTSDQALERYHAQKAARQRVEQARERLADALRDARGLLRDAGVVGVEVGGSLADAPTETVRAAAERTRERLREGRVELERVGETSLQLPDGVVPTEEGVREALQARRAEHARIQEELQSISQALMERGTPAESPGALEAALGGLRPRRAALVRKAQVLEAAHALITDAYDAFREQDQDRLVRLMSSRIQRLTDSRLGPIVVEDMLEDARLEGFGRLLDLASPPLSYGEYHAVLLGVRLGAADFLAGVGVLPPLIVDEPFAHLDRERRRILWDLLCQVARERQVIVTTQDLLLVEDLDVEPDIRLE